MACGTLHAIGAGPGAPDLLTLRAVDILKNADAILAASSTANSYSACLEIARDWIRPEARIVKLDFPMTRDSRELEAAWRKAADTALEILGQVEDAAFLTIGDPLIYSTFGYLYRAMLAMRPDVKIDIVPGITSFQAAAAKTGRILCESTEILKIIPGILPEKELGRELADDSCAVVLKVYRNYQAIYRAMRQNGRAGEAILASNIEKPDEKVDMGLEPGLKLPYMSLLISPPPGGES